MAEPRRVQLTSVTCAAPPADQPAVTSTFSEQVQVKRSDRPADSVRLVVALFEPDERSFPEFSYSQLIDDNLSHGAKDKVPLSRFEEEEKQQNDELAHIAKKLEEKYGKPMKKKDRVQDLIDIGYGYDEEDSFIDNSEAYDEFVPSSITTKFGGFYVNSGVLQFRKASDTETEDLMTEEHSNKRKLNGQDKPRKKRCRDTEEIKTDVDAKSSTTFETAVEDVRKKKKKVPHTLSVTSMLRKFQREKERQRQKMDRANPRRVAAMGTPTIPLCPADAAGGGGSGLADPLLTLIGSTNDHALLQAASAGDFDIDLDTLLDVNEETFLPGLAPQPPKGTQLHQVKTDQTCSTASSDAEPQPSNQKSTDLPRPSPESEAKTAPLHPYSPLPEGLSPELEGNIQKLLVAAKTSEGESKLKFFTPEINSVLLEIEFQCREQGGQLRSKVYTHLSSFLPCSREALLKRVKRLLPNQTEAPLNVEDPIQKLKDAVGRAMPVQIACFHESCQAYEQIKSSKTTEERKDGKQKATPGSEDSVEEKGGKRGGPRKLFQWNEEIRECLCHVLKAKMDKYEGKGSLEMDEYLKTLLDNDIKSIWPKGWMQSRVLMRESKKLLGLFTSLPGKKSRSEKRASLSDAVTVSNTSCCLQGPTTLKGLSQGFDSEVNKVSNISTLIPSDTVKEEIAEERGLVWDVNSSTPEDTHKHMASTTSAPIPSSVSPADQSLAPEQSLCVSQELLAAAVEKYGRSVHWSFSAPTGSPPIPPPPPQCSPINFPEGRMCHVTLPHLLQDLTKHGDDNQVQMISDDDDDIIML